MSLVSIRAGVIRRRSTCDRALNYFADTAGINDTERDRRGNVITPDDIWSALVAARRKIPFSRAATIASWLSAVDFHANARSWRRQVQLPRWRNTTSGRLSARNWSIIRSTSRLSRRLASTHRDRVHALAAHTTRPRERWDRVKCRSRRYNSITRVSRPPSVRNRVSSPARRVSQLRLFSFHGHRREPQELPCGFRWLGSH